MSNLVCNSDGEYIGRVVVDLSSLILKTAEAVGDEQCRPSHEADEMDDFITRGKHQVKELRRIREEFENLCTGLLP